MICIRRHWISKPQPEQILLMKYVQRPRWLGNSAKPIVSSPPLLERRPSENNKYGFRRPFPRFEKPSRGDLGAIKQDMESFLKGE